MQHDELLRAIERGRWDRAEEASLLDLESGRFRDFEERNATAILVAQARLLGGLDPRGALRVLSPVLAGGATGSAPGWRARGHVVSALAFAAPTTTLVDPHKVEGFLRLAHAEIHRSAHDDLRALAGLARLGAGVATPAADALLRGFAEVEIELGRATAPVTRCVVAEVRAAHALAMGRHEDALRALDVALEIALTIGFDVAKVRLRALLDALTNDA